MLPDELKGPSLSIRFSDSTCFVRENSQRFPDLDPDFISQVCYEHPNRFEAYYPQFSPKLHSAHRVHKTASWIRDNVRYGVERPVEMWGWQFDKFRREGHLNSEVFTALTANRTWHFPPVVISAPLAVSLGAKHAMDAPYDLVEGTHRVAYLLRMLELNLIPAHSEHALILIEPKEDISQDTPVDVRSST